MYTVTLNPNGSFIISKETEKGFIGMFSKIPEGSHLSVNIVDGPIEYGIFKKCIISFKDTWLFNKDEFNEQYNHLKGSSIALYRIVDFHFPGSPVIERKAT